MQIAYLNGKYVRLKDAKISILDRGFLYGDGVFETIRAYNGIPFLLEKHIERLVKSLKNLGIRSTVNRPKIKKIVYKLLKKNGLSDLSKKDAYIKIITTRGKTRGLLMQKTGEAATLAIYVLPYRARTKKFYKNGIKLCISETKLNVNSKTAGNKTLSYLGNVMSKYEADKKGFDDAILVNTKGFVSEGTSSNIFLVKREKVYTPDLKSGCLAGITRGEIIKLARKLKLSVKEGLIKPNFLFSASEIFLTNSLIGVAPAVRIENKIVGDGKPGPITNKLMRFFDIGVKNYRTYLTI